MTATPVIYTFFYVVRFDVIMHPVMRRLIDVKWKVYGKRGANHGLSFKFDLYNTLDR